ncbi:TMEM175 family protein [Lactiplantibacillus plantarum]|nr:TMEM175 family protein [Lactiplantibacillus plantarum]WCE42752.1 TMEM175 family protein [Lactiplantibacillus plantarum]
MKTDRFQAFSDGIFAILITILVLEFHIPDYQPGHLLAALLAQWPLILSYVFSYFYVGTLWLFHHEVDCKINPNAVRTKKISFL